MQIVPYERRLNKMGIKPTKTCEHCTPAHRRGMQTSGVEVPQSCQPRTEGKDQTNLLEGQAPNLLYVSAGTYRRQYI